MTASVSLCMCGDHAWKATNLGYTIIVSPEDVGLLKFNWHAHVDQRGYVSIRRNVGSGKARAQIRMAREITKPGEGMVADHISRNTLDNRRTNLRVCTPSENCMNRAARRGKAVSLKGVSIRRGNYVAHIGRNGQTYLGSFQTPEEAHAAYQKAAREFYGEFARVS